MNGKMFYDILLVRGLTGSTLRIELSIDLDPNDPHDMMIKEDNLFYDLRVQLPEWEIGSLAISQV